MLLLRPFLVASLVAVASTAAAAKTVHVEIDGLAFKPAVVDVAPGDTVEWSNKDFIDHSATSDDRGWDVVIPAGEKRTLLFEKAVSTGYFCRIHPNMRGRIEAAGQRAKKKAGRAPGLLSFSVLLQWQQYSGGGGMVPGIRTVPVMHVK